SCCTKLAYPPTGCRARGHQGDGAVLSGGAVSRPEGFAGEDSGHTVENLRGGTSMSSPPAHIRLNREWFQEMSGAEFVGSSPHLKHRTLRQRCLGIAVDLFGKLAQHKQSVRVLDMGAGDGMLTLPYLELGARVTAIDATPELLDALQTKAAGHQGRLTVIAGDIFDALGRLQQQSAQFDLICASSFLHHVPDYLQLF